LLWGENLLQQRRQLGLAEHAARFHVGEQVLQVADASGQALHLAQALVHLFQALRHVLEAFRQPGFQRLVEFFVHGGTHFVQLGGVALLQLVELGFQRGAHLAQSTGIGLAQGL